MTAPNRTPRQIIDAILANLEMAKEAAYVNGRKAETAEGIAKYIGEFGAYLDAIKLIETETKDLL